MYKLILSLYVVTTTSALVFLKQGTKSGAILRSVENKLQLNLSPYVVTGIMLYGVSFILYTYLISKYDLGYIVPLATAFVYISIVTSSYFVFHETFTTLKIAGIILIVIGLVLLNLNK
jgi:drug/metabolite transporter (DMT)-like permease